MSSVPGGGPAASAALARPPMRSTPYQPHEHFIIIEQIQIRRDLLSMVLTKHGEDEVLGRVDLQSPLVVILTLVVFAKLLDEAVQLVHPGPRPEVQLWAGLQALVIVVGGTGGSRGATTEAPHRPSPTRERRGRHVTNTSSVCWAEESRETNAPVCFHIKGPSSHHPVD